MTTTNQTISSIRFTKTMTKKLLAPLLTLFLFASGPARAQTNDPSGGNTGTIGDVSGSGGSYSYPTFQVSALVDLSADDKKDTNKVAAYDTTKKAFDDYTAQSAKRAPGNEAGGRGRPQPDFDQLCLDAGHRIPGDVHAGRLRVG